MAKNKDTAAAVRSVRTIRELIRQEENKETTITIRTTHTIKELLRLAAQRERRSIASMLEILILSHAEKYALGEETLARIEEEHNKSVGRVRHG